MDSERIAIHLRGSFFQPIPEGVKDEKTFIPEPRFMGEVCAPRTQVGLATLRERQQDVILGLSGIIISRMAAGGRLKKISRPLSLIEICSNDQVSLDLLIGCDGPMTKTELEDAAKAFLVKGVIETAQRLWWVSSIGCAASERNLIRHLQDLKTRGWTTKRIARRLCNNYELPLEEFYSEKPQPSQLLTNREIIKVIRF